ncbi:MAG: formate/nitrite transporter family protein [Spirochaetales bacterium]|nr:formate/nitrite transporter family protein [Spirochaetales bacterium]
MNTYLTPPAIAEEMVKLGVKKAGHSFGNLLILSIMAGGFIGFAANFATIVATGWQVQGEPAFYGLSKFLLGASFSVGLMLVLLLGAELFTGNCLMPAALFRGQISLSVMLKNWAIVWLGNLIGSLVLAWMIAGLSGLLEGSAGYTAVKIAASKASLTGVQIFIRGILANWIVCLAILMMMAATDVTGKIWAAFFPITGFAASSFEHSIANMYFIPAGILSRSSHPAADPEGALTIFNFLRNLLFSTAGNIVGGAVLVASVFYFVHLRNSSTEGIA